MRMPQKFVSIMANELDLRKSVANLSGRMSSHQILQMFKDKPISRAIIFRVLKHCRDSKKQENKKKSSRLPEYTRRLGRKFGISHSTVHRFSKKNNISYRRRKQAPKYSARQLEIIPKCCNF